MERSLLHQSRPCPSINVTSFWAAAVDRLLQSSNLYKKAEWTSLRAVASISWLPAEAGGSLRRLHSGPRQPRTCKLCGVSKRPRRYYRWTHGWDLGIKGNGWEWDAKRIDGSLQPLPRGRFEQRNSTGPALGLRLLSAGYWLDLSLRNGQPGS